VTIRDVVRSQARLADHLGIGRWLSVLGGSMGGMQALEWSVMFPERVRSAVALATTSAASAWQIAYSAAGRRAVALDPKWRGGDYYDADPGDGPHRGLEVARALAQITYRSDHVFEDRFGREWAEQLGGFDLWQRFEVESYLEYHGEKLARRFDANSYLLLNKMMDLHDLGRGRGGVARALARIQAPTLTMSISSDTLYPPHLQEALRDDLRAAGKEVEYAVVDSPHGHDGFLLELEPIGKAVHEFLTEIEKSDD
jgi:homoserine O-acetyltransferase